MNKINNFYCIVPLNDGYNYICQNRDTLELYPHKKACATNFEKLVFSSEQEAQSWIDKNNYNDRFKVEWFATTEEFVTIKKITGV